MAVLRRIRETLRTEAAPTLKLAGPVVLGQLGIMLMGLVDTRMVAPLGDVSIGAVAIGSAVFHVLYMAGMGMLLGLDRVASVASGARDFAGLRRVFVQGQWLALAFGAVLTVLGLVASHELHRFVASPEVAAEGAKYVRAIAWSMAPSLLFTANRQVLQAMDDVRAATVLLLLANVVNWFANDTFIHGRFGFDAMGAEGAGWATFVSRTFLAAALLSYTRWRDIGGVSDGLAAGATPAWSFGWVGAIQRELAVLGVPAAGHLLLEVGVFALSTFVAERMGTVALAAHQLVLLIASFTFMVPLGLSFAGAVRVGQAAGRGDAAAAKRAGWAAVLLSIGFMVLSGFVLAAAGRWLMSGFGVSDAVVSLGARVIVVAALFQAFDGAQVSLGGALRGAGDTRSTFFANLAGHWLIGFPLGLWLGFPMGLGPVGLWLGLAAGLGSVAVALLVVWRRRVPTPRVDGSP